MEYLHLGMVSLHEGDNDDIEGKTNRRSKLAPIMLLILPIIPSRISQKIVPLFFFYSPMLSIIPKLCSFSFCS